MALTINPAFPQVANVGELSPLLSTAMTNTKAFDGTEALGTAMRLIYTAGAESINQITKIRVQYSSVAGSTATGTTAASVVRFWLNSGGANAHTTASNNQLLGELALPAQAMTALATAINPILEFPLNIPNLPAGYRIYAGTTVATGGAVNAFLVTAFGGNY